MPAHNYFELVTEWTLEGTLAEVNSVLKNVEAFPQWWRPVYISANLGAFRIVIWRRFACV